MISGNLVDQINLINCSKQMLKRKPESKKKEKERLRMKEALQKKKLEKERMTRVLADLEKSYVEPAVLDKFHSSKNLDVDFEKQVERKKTKSEKEKMRKEREALEKLNPKQSEESEGESQSQEPTTLPGKKGEDSSTAPETAQKPVQKSLVINQLGPGLNLFDVKSFEAEESFEHLKVVPIVDREKMRKEQLSLQIKNYDKYTLENPFQCSAGEFLEGKALAYLEDYVDEDRDVYLKDFLILESDTMRKIAEFDNKLAAGRQKPRIGKRSEEILKVKSKLPVTLKELEIMDSVMNNLITVVCGATGSGKSTQIPQFLYESGLGHQGMIGITQPRRLAAISLAQRVAEETGTKLGDLVGFQVRYEASKFGPSTKTKFMTDGILLNEMMSDFLLTKYSVIVIDEAHERRINTDLLIGLLSRVIRIRAKLSLKERESSSTQSALPSSGYKMNPLRLIIMSATLRVTDFTENKFLFAEEKINVINVEARMFPVKIFHEKHTKEDYVREALEKVIKIHTKLPKGGILVFLTGEEEIKYFCSQLEIRLKNMKADRERAFYEIEEDAVPEEEYELPNEEVEDTEREDLQEEITGNSKRMLEETIAEKEAEDAIKKKSFKEKMQKAGLEKSGLALDDYFICPLYTKLPLPEQQRIFKFADEKKRLIVVSTNVAETSLTIPNVKYVVDSGKEKKKVFNEQKTLGRFEIDWISQSSAKQREGRAGRTCSGFCYRVYTLAVYNKFEEFSAPEILKEPLDSSVLTLKTIGIHQIERFPFVTRPSVQSIIQAESELETIGALDAQKKITRLGSALSQLPIKPRLGKLMLLSKKAELLGIGLLLVTVLSTEEIFDSSQLKEELRKVDEEERPEKEAKKLKRILVHKYKSIYNSHVCEKSDLITEANILGDYLSFVLTAQKVQGDTLNLNRLIMDYCRTKKLQFKSIREAYSLVLHLLKITETLLPTQGEKEAVRDFFQNFKSVSTTLVPQVIELIVATMADKAARRITFIEEDKEKQALETTEHEGKTNVHPSSFVFNRKPQFLVYNEVIETAEGRIFLARVTEVEDPYLLVKYDPSGGKSVSPVLEFLPQYSVKNDIVQQVANCTFSKKVWPLERVHVEAPVNLRAKYLCFATALLNGKVLPGFKVLGQRLTFKLAEKYADEPKYLKPLVDVLQNRKVASKESFISLERSSDTTLKTAVLNLVDPKYKQKLESLWPRLIKP